jgi:hypothetical protein
MADDLKIPSFTKQKKPKAPALETVQLNTPPEYVPLTDEQIEACRKGQDIFEFARDIEEVVRVNNKI